MKHDLLLVVPPHYLDPHWTPQSSSGGVPRYLVDQVLLDRIVSQVSLVLGTKGEFLHYII